MLKYLACGMCVDWGSGVDARLRRMQLPLTHHDHFNSEIGSFDSGMA